MDERFKKLLEGSDECLFLNGGCHVFALALQKQFHYPLVLVRENGTQNVPHVFCRSGEFAVDGMGFTIEKDVFSAKEWIQPLFSAEIITPSELEKHYVYTAPCPGLYADDSFMSQARRQAKKRITDYIRFYDGTCKCQIRPHPFLKKTTNAEYDSIFK
jgi:hypothetical protein